MHKLCLGLLGFALRPLWARRLCNPQNGDSYPLLFTMCVSLWTVFLVMKIVCNISISLGPGVKRCTPTTVSCFTIVSCLVMKLVCNISISSGTGVKRCSPTIVKTHFLVSFALCHTSNLPETCKIFKSFKIIVWQLFSGWEPRRVNQFRGNLSIVVASLIWDWLCLALICQ